ncbi:M1 family metallopeptidase [Citricoccus sp. NPDC055426]|uniref:M1 family metallopeptidase n=1 Tax=Citricoccus sp. NPDC055426 TaxID=3155536 RepID=UPI003420B1A2
MSEETPALPDPYVPGSGTGDFTVGHYDLQLEVKLAANRIAGRARLEGTVLHPLKRVELDLHALSAGKVSARSGQRAVKVTKTSVRQDRLVIELGSQLEAGTDLSLDISYTGVPRMLQGLWGEVGWEELEDGVLVAGQPNGAQTWFPCVDHPSVKSTYSIAISTDAGYLPVCNGVPTGHRRRSSREEWTWELREPAPSYLVTVQIGRYQLVAVPEHDAGRQTPAESVPVFLATSPALLDRAQAALGLQTRMMDCFSRHYGSYPFERYTAVVTDDELEIPLEAASLSIFGANHLDGSWASERLVAHELAHQWFGNALTLRQWKDIWLHEGFACYSEWLWSEESGQASLRTQARRAWRGLFVKPRTIVVADPGPELMFDDRIYKRGALTLYALRCALGSEVFAALIRSWVAEHRHGTVDTALFLDHADRHAQSAGHPEGLTTEVMRPWLFESGLPAFPTSDPTSDPTAEAT